VLKVEERQSITDVLTGLAVAAALLFIILPLLSLLLTYVMRVKKHHRGLYIFMGTYSNVGFMGIPVIEALCGSTGLFYAAIFNLMFNLSIFTLGVIMMNAGKENDTKLTAKSLLTPGVILSVIALVVYLLNLKVPFIVTDTIDMVGSITSPSAMLLIGCSLAKMDIRKVFSNIIIYPWTLIKQIAIPLLLWLPLVTVIKNETLLTVSYILTAMPVANNAVLFATNYDSDVDSASRGVFITTLFALISVPLCVLIV
jgi:predicted permease